MVNYGHDVDITDQDEMYKLAMMHGHLPGIYCWKDSELKYLFASDNTAKKIGFKGVEDFIGANLTDQDARCPVVELADQFAIDDRWVIQQKKSLTLMECICYSGNEWSVFIVEKFPILAADGKVKAVGVNGIDMTNANLAILNFDFLIPNNHRVKKKERQFSLTIGNIYKKNVALSGRQAECLFYLLRGGTAKSISQRLTISMRTAESHVNALKYKFNCQTKQQLIEKLISLGYLNLVPETCIFK